MRSIDLGEVRDGISLKDIPDLKGDGGLYIFHTLYARLNEGNKEKELYDGTFGKVLYITITGVVRELQSEKDVGKTNITVYLNTKSRYMASKVAALCGAYDYATKHSKIETKEETVNDKTFERVPGLENKDFLIGLALGGTFENKDGDVINSYNLIDVLSLDGRTSKEFVDNKVIDSIKKQANCEKILVKINEEVKRYKEQEDSKAQAMQAQGLGMQTAQPFNPSQQPIQQPIQNPQQWQQQVQAFGNLTPEQIQTVQTVQQLNQSIVQATANKDEIPF